MRPNFARYDSRNFEWHSTRELCIKAFVVGGGSPCQGDSSLNRNRIDSDEARNWQLVRLTSVLASRFFPIPTLSCREIVASFTKTVFDLYSKFFGVQPVHVRAGTFGWAKEGDCFGTAVPRGFTIEDATLKLPEGESLRWVGDVPELSWSEKPLPMKLRLADGAKLGNIDPKRADEGLGTMFRITLRILPPFGKTDATVQAQLRWDEDGKRFPMSACRLTKQAIWLGSLVRGGHWGRKRVLHAAGTDLLAFRMHCGWSRIALGPTWCLQQEQASTRARLGMERATGASKRGLHKGLQAVAPDWIFSFRIKFVGLESILETCQWWVAPGCS